MMRSIVASTPVRALATNRVVASWLIVVMWGASMALAFMPGIVLTSLMAFFHPMFRIMWHKAYRSHRAEINAGKKMKLQQTACGCA